MISSVFLLAAVGKFLEGESFRAVLRLSEFPEWLVRLLVFFVPLGELGVVFGIFLSSSYILSIFFALAVCSLLLFTGWMFFIIKKGINIRCGCFGNASAKVGKGSVFRNLCLLCFALLGLILTFQYKSLLPKFCLELVMVSVSLYLYSPTPFLHRCTSGTDTLF